MGPLISFIADSIQFLYELTASFGFPNYGIAIILFTLAIKTILLPLTAKQVKAMRMMQKLQPEIQEIQKKNKNNPQKSQKMIMDLYKKNKTNPFSGCWPMLVQMPILIALFMALREFFIPYSELEGIGNPNLIVDHVGFLWIPTLGMPDPLHILPILVAAGMFAQQKVSISKEMLDQNPTQKMLLYALPLFIGFISTTFPSALALYWMVYSIIGIIETKFFRRSAERKEELAKKEEIASK